MQRHIPMRTTLDTKGLFISGLLGLLALAGCADDAQTEPEPQPDAGSLVDECPRLQMDTLNDCIYTESVDLDIPEEVDAFCQSDCRGVLSVHVFQENPTDDLSLLAGTTEITGSAKFDNAKGLKTLHGMEQVEKVGENLHFHYNDDLESLEALSSLKSVGLEWRSELIILGNPKLETLDGLESLETINRNLVIENNNNLRSIEALESLESVENIKIQNNPKLPTCQAEALVERINPPGAVVIAGNGSGSCD